MSEHTPGPWTVRAMPNEFWLMAKQGPLDVCPAKTFGLPDARLVSAAPDLLEALEAALEQLDDVNDCTSAEWRSDALRSGTDFQKAIELAEAAIAKAKGEAA